MKDDTELRLNIPANDHDILHHDILVALSDYKGPHKYKAAVLFSEAMTEVRTAIDAGEFKNREDAAHALVAGCEALANEAAIYLTDKKPGT